MRNHPGTSDYITLADRLSALFEIIPDSELLSAPRSYYAGRRGYGIETLWQTYVAMAYLNVPSFAALIRLLQDNPDLRTACGITSIEGVPSTFAYSRFMRKLARPRYERMVWHIFRDLTQQCYRTFPEFAKGVAIDSTDVKAWSNGRSKPISDPDAGWVIKPDTAGKRKFVWGYKIHVMSDVKYELPISVCITKGNTADVKMASPLLGQARGMGIKFNPDYVICDAGYSSEALRHSIKRQYRAEPIIKVNAAHTKAVKRWPETPEFRAAYDKRTSIERLFGRLKCHRRLNNITVRRIRKVKVHCLLPLIITQAQALVRPDSPRACTI